MPVVEDWHARQVLLQMRTCFNPSENECEIYAVTAHGVYARNFLAVLCEGREEHSHILCNAKLRGTVKCVHNTHTFTQKLLNCRHKLGQKKSYRSGS